MSVVVIYTNGDIETFRPTFLSATDGDIIEDDYYHSGIDSILTDGLVMDRSTYHLQDNADDDFTPPGETQLVFPTLLQQGHALVLKRNIGDIAVVFIDGMRVLERTTNGLENVILRELGLTEVPAPTPDPEPDIQDETSEDDEDEGNILRSNDRLVVY